jgi:hypothetical protein
MKITHSIADTMRGHSKEYSHYVSSNKHSFSHRKRLHVGWQSLDDLVTSCFVRVCFGAHAGLRGRLEGRRSGDNRARAHTHTHALSLFLQAQNSRERARSLFLARTRARTRARSLTRQRKDTKGANYRRRLVIKTRVCRVSAASIENTFCSVM